MVRKIQRAIVSVTDKRGVVEFAKELHQMGVEIISTGGTGELLKKEGIPMIPISSYTGFPEMLDGRLKTLHPKIHGGILGMRDKEKHIKEMEDYQIPVIDMVVVNLYAFEDVVARGASLEEAIENIDIGGPTMIRAAAKNYRFVAPVVDPVDYDSIIEEMKANDGGLSLSTRFRLAKKVFSLTARYDGAIANYLTRFSDDSTEQEEFPSTLNIQFEKVQQLRYGENPHQKAVFYRERKPSSATVAAAKKHHGKELSYNNILDTDSALSLIKELTEPACAIIKHNNPCGVAVSKEGHLKAYELALACDPRSAFGGIVAINGTIDEELAEKLNEIFLEVIISYGYTEGALEILKKKKNIRLLEVEKGEPEPGFDVRSVSGGLLLQSRDTESAGDLKVVTRRGPTEEELRDLLFAWVVCKHVKSNAIVLVKDEVAIGIGPGQTSRVDSARIALMKAEEFGHDPKGAVLASDAFFPFRDNIDLVAEYGITAIIQPGGSIRDEEVIKAADEHDMAMVFTGIRHFKH